MSEASVLLTRASPAVATLRLNRPQRRNAFDDHMIADLSDAFDALQRDASVRVLVLAAAGDHFCAGADLQWMRRMADCSYQENYRDAQAMARMLQQLDELPQVSIARVQGPAYGGGLGLISCCDIAIGVPTASFCLSEVRLGLIPATIAPYVVAAIGRRAARRYFTTAERFTAARAQALGLLSEVAAADQLDAAVQRCVGELLKGGPQALTAGKRLVARVAHEPRSEALLAATSEGIARLRTSAEGQEGMRAFLEKRQPDWQG